MRGGLPQACYENVLKRIGALGGRATFGWKVRTLGGGWESREGHCVWESPSGELVCVTPVWTSASGSWGTAEYPEAIAFEPDEAATFGSNGKPSTGYYTPPDDSPRMKRAAVFLRRSDEALNADNLEGCRYWTAKANAELRAAGCRYGFEAPESLDMAERIRVWGSQM
jgi:hypothetical protein